MYGYYRVYVRDCTITTMLSQQALDYRHWYAQYRTTIDIYGILTFMLHVYIQLYTYCMDRLSHNIQCIHMYTQTDRHTHTHSSWYPSPPHRPALQQWPACQGQWWCHRLLPRRLSWSHPLSAPSCSVLSQSSHPYHHPDREREGKTTDNRAIITMPWCINYVLRMRMTSEWWVWKNYQTKKDISSIVYYPIPHNIITVLHIICHTNAYLLTMTLSS